MLGATLWSPSVAGTRELFLGCRKSLWDNKKFAKADVHRCSAVCSGLGSVESTVAKLKQESRGRKLAHTLLRFLCPVTSPRSAWIYVPNSQPPPTPAPFLRLGAVPHGILSPGGFSLLLHGSGKSSLSPSACSPSRHLFPLYAIDDSLFDLLAFKEQI